MKFLSTATVTVTCAVLLVSCGRKQADNAEIEKQVQARLAEEHQAEQQRELHEREAALDERERLLAQREQETASPAGQQPAPTVAAGPATPLALLAPLATPAPPSPNASYQAFYDYLSPYGAWVEMPGYGYVWQPSATVQNRNWRPYTLGHWAFSDNGWTWISDEPFGWITYHYGRWMRTLSTNWVWVPGNQWAPAWVSWRYGDDYAGWAPLPPEARFDGAASIQQWADQQYNLGAADYTFVPASEFGDENMASVAVAPDQDGQIYEDSNNITNIYYDSGATAIFCYGPNYDFMRSKVHQPLPPLLHIRRGGFSAGGHNGAVVSGNTLEITAPRILQSQAPVAPKTVRGRVADARFISPLGAPDAAGAVEVPAKGMRLPSQMKPVPVSPELQGEKTRELQSMPRQEAPEAEQQRREAGRVERPVVEAPSTKAVREQSARELVVHPTLPGGVPQPSVAGR